MTCTRKNPRPTSGALCLIVGLTISPWYLALVCEHRATCGPWILMDSVYNRLSKSMDISGLLKVMPGLWHCSLLQLAVQVLGCCPIMSSSTFPGGLTCLTLCPTCPWSTANLGNSSLEELQPIWAANPSSYCNWSSGKKHKSSQESAGNNEDEGIGLATTCKAVP